MATPDIGIAGWLFSQEILRDKTMTLLDLPQTCADLGVSTVELCSAFFTSQDTRYLNDLRQRLSDNGLTVRNIAVDMGNIAGSDAAVRRTDIETLKQWFYAASAIGSAAIRINTGNADDPNAQQRVIDGYRELIRVGESAGVKLLMENHGGLSSYPHQVAAILDAVDSDWFGSCPDTANFATADWNDGMRALAPRAFTCHVKVFSHDADGTQRWEAGRSGETRSYDLAEGLRILRDAGYTGPLCIERSVPKGEGASVSTGFAETKAYLADLVARV